MLARGTSGSSCGGSTPSFGESILADCFLTIFQEESIFVVMILSGAVKAGMQLQMMAMLTSQMLEGNFSSVVMLYDMRMKWSV